ncbi:sensor histidine kinase [Aquimarina sp. 2201CG5-10]|uniref:sensor histidine kinase n=1 Tax=Aquimarina callyspongiae TaxID=3098150 RepID=UPI002AB3B355|nr:histidine kinase [Aquimarina sp. 2201CG5-10]MDY8136060.1 histidine kinase [Aquimarina sp. 2201CG5-10]
MLFNKKKRIQYLGFNDVWFSIVGILILSLSTDYIFNNSFQIYPLGLAFYSWGASLIVTICDWLAIRRILIFLRKKYPDFRDDVKRMVIFFFAIVTTILVVDYVGGHLIEYIYRLLGKNANYITQLKVLLPVTLVTIMIMAIYEAMYYYVRLKTSIRAEEQAKQVMIQAQLDTLRNQAQPHFLFNSLNTLRDIIDQDSKEDAKGFVDNLSDVYRFIIESGNSNLISLEKELKFAKAYIHIQSERFGENLKLNWNIPEDKLLVMIVPMSLQLLLENAIKHNIVSKSKPLLITVAIKDDTLVVSNKIQAKSTQTPSTKIGLKNIKKRYQLISSKTPIINNDGEHFTVSLPLLKSTKEKS